MDLAFEYVKTAPLETSESYPYKATKGSCMYSNSKGKGAITGYTNVKKYSVSHLKAAIDQGPVSVAVEASSTHFQYYINGVLNNPKCGIKLDHGILAVGYGTEKGQDYFLVKN
jgi:hypothetical protein